MENDCVEATLSSIWKKKGFVKPLNSKMGWYGSNYGLLLANSNWVIFLFGTGWSLPYWLQNLGLEEIVEGMGWRALLYVSNSFHLSNCAILDHIVKVDYLVEPSMVLKVKVKVKVDYLVEPSTVFTSLTRLSDERRPPTPRPPPSCHGPQRLSRKQDELNFKNGLHFPLFM